MRPLLRLQPDQQVEIATCRRDGLAHLVPLRGHGIGPAVQLLARLLGLLPFHRLGQFGVPSGERMLRKMRRDGFGQFGEIAVFGLAERRHDLFRQQIRIGFVELLHQIAGGGDGLIIDILHGAGGIVDPLEHR